MFQNQDLEQEVISKRNYQALVFGYTVTSPADLYAFWHSSQRTYPGLNITGYQDAGADKLLADIISETNEVRKTELLSEFVKKISSDTPAVFIYNPADIIISKQNLSGNIPLQTLGEPYDRFNTIASWYIHTDTVWKVFHRNE